MKSEYPLPEQVLDDLGDKVAQGLALMVGRTRTDLETYRRTFPAWVADSTDRGLLNWCHDRAWVHALRIFDGVPEVSSVDQPPTRELYRWDPERRELGAAVISLRDGYDHVIWMHELDEPAGGVGTTTTPILSPTEPSVPEIEMPSDGEHGKDAKGTEGR